MTNEKKICEQTTGISQHGNLIFWSKDKKITLKQAKENLIAGEEVAIPNAGAGSFREIFKKLGFEEVKVIDWTSSAGDWSFGVKNEDGWILAGQENRYPYYGFTYMVTSVYGKYQTFEELCKEITD